MKKVFGIRQRSLSSSSRRRKYRRLSETEEFQMTDVPVEEYSERTIFVDEINTESWQEERSRQESQPIIFVTHAIIERENISEYDLGSQEN